MDKEKELPQRKRLRLQNFDYSSSGAYFITICTKDRKMLFAPVGADSISARMVERTFLETIRQYDGVDSPLISKYGKDRFMITLYAIGTTTTKYINIFMRTL